jgi:hypothetical protein
VIELVLFLTAGAGFLLLLYLLARRRNSQPEGGAGALVEARQALDSLQMGLLPRELVERIFAREDLDFVRRTCPRKIQDSFLRERKRIALSWIAHVRKQVLNLRRFHSGQSRRYAKLEFRTEIALALDFVSLLIVCRVLQAIFYVRGPYAAPRIVGKAISVAGNLCGVSERSLAFLKPRNADLYRGNSAGDRAAV